MRVLVTGNGRNGSWQIRGEQLGAAIGARVVPLASLEECEWADLVVLVKRGSSALIEAIHASGRPLIWDVVDAWPQPQQQPSLSELDARHWLKRQIRSLAPDAIVWPTSRMQADADWYGPQIVLPHHAWDRYAPKPLSGAVARVGYEGAPHYLGRWDAALAQACKRRGWHFAVGSDLATCDIGVALRDRGGYAARHWKSNVKLANLQALGIPALCSPEVGYREFASGVERWIETPADLERAFDEVAPVAERVRIRKVMTAATPRLAGVACDYERFLRGLT